MLSKMPLNYQRSCFTWRNWGFVHVACMEVAYEQVLPLEEPREATREQHTNEDASVRGGEREEEVSSLHSIDIPNFFKHRGPKGAAKIHDGSARSSSVIDYN